MTDIFIPPTKEEIEKLRETFGDALLSSIMKEILRSLNNKEYVKSCEALWFSLTRQMFHNLTVAAVYNQVDMALVEASNEDWLTDKYPKEVFDENLARRKVKIVKNKIGKTIDANLKITEVAKRYGIEIKGKKALCPFHEDNNPSLTFSDKRNIFRCFGCNARGDIVEFIRRMEELKGGDRDGKDRT
jgi:hypothetical protein